MRAIRVPRWSFLALVALVAFASTEAMAARIKCWTNHEGVRECGNIVPPEFAQKGHEEINERGLTVRTKQRAKTPEEIEAEREEQARLEEQRKLDEEQAKRDQILLATYATEYDMRLAHKGKVAAIDSRIAHAKHLVKRLQESLVELVQDAANQERSGKDVSDETLARISEVKNRSRSKTASSRNVSKRSSRSTPASKTSWRTFAGSKQGSDPTRRTTPDCSRRCELS